MTGPDLSLTAALIKFFIYPGELVQHIFLTSEGFHHLQVLEGLLIEGHLRAGKLLVLLLIFPHLHHGIAGDDQGNRRAAQGDEGHGHIVLHHDNEGRAEANQRGNQIGQEGQHMIGDHPRVPVDPVQQIAGAVRGQGLPIRLQDLPVDIPPNLIGDLQADAQRQAAEEAVALLEQTLDQNKKE